jgi:hypothetical protein
VDQAKGQNFRRCNFLSIDAASGSAIKKLDEFCAMNVYRSLIGLDAFESLPESVRNGHSDIFLKMRDRHIIHWNSIESQDGVLCWPACTYRDPMLSDLPRDLRKIRQRGGQLTLPHLGLE